MAQMNPFGSTAGNQFGGDTDISESVLGLKDAFPMPSDLNRAFAIIGGQEDPAIKQGAVNLQTVATLAQLKERREQNKRQSINDLLDFASKLDLDDETTTKITKMAISANPGLKEYFGKELENLSVSVKSKTPIVITRYWGENELPDPTNPGKRLPAGTYKTKGRLVRGEYIPSEVEPEKPTDLKEKAVAALAEGKPLPGFTLEETKKMAGGLVEGNKALNQQAATAIAKNQPLPGFTIEETKRLAGVGKETQPDQFSRLASEISARRSGKPAGSAVAELKGFNNDELIKKFLGEANLAEALMAMLGLGGTPPASPGPTTSRPVAKYPTDADVSAAVTEAKGDKVKAKEILRKKGFAIKDK